MKRALTVLLLLCCVVAAFAQQTPLKLKIGDVIRVVVIGYAEFTSDYAVLSDGNISGIGFGRLKASGKSIDEVESQIKKRLTKFINNPQVSVVLTIERINAVYLIRGEASSALPPTAGAIKYVPGMELRQLLALGALPPDPEMFELKVYRGSKLLHEVDLAALLAGDAAQWNGPMVPDDVVTVLPRPLVRVWITGSVQAPGEYRLRKGMAMQQAISRAGGFSGVTDGTDLSVLIRRGPETLTFEAKVTPTSPNPVLEEGDTVIVQSNIISVSVSGEVNAPGMYRVNSGRTLASVVGAEAKGASAIGSLREVLVLRKGEMFIVDATAPTPNSQAFLLENDDSVFVFQSEAFVSVHGTVNSPGRIYIKEKETLRLNDALLRAGGLAQGGSYRRVYVLTPENGKMVVRQYNLDEWLKDGNLDANPILPPKTIVLFGQPKGVTLDTVTKALSTLLILDNIVKR